MIVNTTKYKNVEDKINETYKHIRQYLKNETIQNQLYPMCSICECWYGKEHDYNECLDKCCFQYFLSFKYLEWLE